MPIENFEQTLLIAIGLGVFVLILTFIWYGTRDLSAGWRWFGRVGLSALVSAPLVVAILAIPVGQKRLQAPSLDASPRQSAQKKKAVPAPSDDGGAANPRTAEAPPPLLREEAEKPPAAATRGLTSSAAAPSDKWHIVPVFFGTDRAAEPNRKPVAGFSAQRGKKLQVGRALVSIPKVHQVPDIERPWVYKLPFTNVVLYREKEDPERHFTLRTLQVLSREATLALVRKQLEKSAQFKDHALVFVHGFNTSFDDALFRTAQISYDLKFDGAPFVYSWPSKGEVTSYSYDRESAGQAQPYLKAFLEMVATASGAKKVSVIAHSMGNQLLLPVLRDLKNSLPESVKLSQIILAAPDVDRDTFEFLAREIQGVGRGVTLYANANDRALQASRQFWGGVPRAGDVPPSGPVIVAGIDTIDVSATSTNIFSLNHSGYARNKALLGDIQKLLQTGERPPERRIPILERISTATGIYWKYPTAPR